MNTLEDPTFEEEHDKLLKLSVNPALNIPSITALNLSNRNYRSVPPSQTLINFTNLLMIDLSHNRIERFIAINIVLGAPLLEELDLSHNNIKTLDDIVELGALQHLNVFTFTDNPISKRYLRIKMIELLLFPRKYQTHDPVKILTATYNIGLNKAPAEKWQAISNKNIPARSRSESPEKKGKGYTVKGSDLLKVAEEKCPVPRKTRFPELEILNGEMISVHDMQSILATQDLAQILPDTDMPVKVVKPVRFERLHEKYIFNYIKKKERRKDEMNQVPSLRRIANIMGEDSDLKLIYYADHMRYGKRKNAKQDYEEQLWKMSSAYKGKDDNLIEDAVQSEDEEEDDESSVDSRHKRKDSSGVMIKSKSEKGSGKKENKDNKDKEPIYMYKGRKESTKKRWNRKDSVDEKQEREDAKSSESELSERNSPPKKKKSKPKEEELAAERNEEEEVDIVELQEHRNEVSDEMSDLSQIMQSTLKSDHRGRSVSLTKFNKDTKRSKRVSFNEDSSFRDDKDDLGSSKEIKLFNFRRANSVLSTRISDINNEHQQKSFRDFIPVPRTIRPESTGLPAQEKTGKKYQVMRDSTPNISLTQRIEKKLGAGLRNSFVQSDKDSTKSKPPRSVPAAEMRKEKARMLEERTVTLSPERRSNTVEQMSTDCSKPNREHSSSKRHYMGSLSARTESDQKDNNTGLNQSMSRNKGHLVLQKVSEGHGFESIEEIREIEQTAGLISTFSKASFLTPIKKFSQKTSFHQQSVNEDMSPMTTFPDLSPKLLDKSPSKELKDLPKGPGSDVLQQHEEYISSTITNVLKYGTLDSQKPKGSPTKTEKLYSGVVDTKAYLKLFVAKKNAQKIKDHDRESRKLAQVIFLNRASSAAFSARQDKRSNSTGITSLIQQQQQRSQQQIPLIQPQQQKTLETIGVQQRTGEAQENKQMFQKLFTQLVSQQKTFISKGAGQNTDRPSFYFAKSQTGYGNTSSRLVISRSQQEQSTDLRSPEKTRLRTEEDAPNSASLMMTKKMTSSFLSARQSGGGQGKVKTKAVDVAFSYGEPFDKGGKFGKFFKV